MLFWYLLFYSDQENVLWSFSTTSLENKERNKSSEMLFSSLGPHSLLYFYVSRRAIVYCDKRPCKLFLTISWILVFCWFLQESCFLLPYRNTTRVSILREGTCPLPEHRNQPQAPCHHREDRFTPMLASAFPRHGAIKRPRNWLTIRSQFKQNKAVRDHKTLTINPTLFGQKTEEYRNEIWLTLITYITKFAIL